MVVGEESLQGDTDLMQIADALASLRSGLGYGKCWQQQRRKDSDDGDDDQ